MEALKILEQQQNVAWNYDEEADVLYLSFGSPKEVLGIDIGDGVVVRFDEPRNEVVGLTVIGLRSRLLKQLKSNDSSWWSPQGAHGG